MDITQARYKAGDIGEDDLLKMKLQLLQFQTDVSQAQLARVQGLSDLRQLLGYESVGPDYDVAGDFNYQPVTGSARRLSGPGASETGRTCGRRMGVTAANSQYNCRKRSAKEM